MPFTRNHRVRKSNLAAVAAELRKQGIEYEVHEPRMSAQEYYDWREYSFWDGGDAPDTSRMVSIHCNMSSGEFSRAVALATGSKYERHYAGYGDELWSYIR